MTEQEGSKEYAIAGEITKRQATDMEIAEMVGKDVCFRPYSFRKGDYLFSTQAGQVSELSLNRRVQRESPKSEMPVEILLSLSESGKIQVTVFDGHHRVAVAFNTRATIRATVIGIHGRGEYQDIRRWPFRLILRNIRRLAGGLENPLEMLE